VPLWLGCRAPQDHVGHGSWCIICSWAVNIDSLPQSSYPSSSPKDWDLTLTGLHQRVCHMPSSPTTIAIKRVWRWSRLRCYMVIGVEPHCFGVWLENGRFSVLTFCKKPRSKFVWLGRTCELRNQTEELRWSWEKRVELWSWRFCTPQGVTYERFAPFQGTSQAHTEDHWTIQEFGE
jgi:hypothetical protein